MFTSVCVLLFAMALSVSGASQHAQIDLIHGQKKKLIFCFFFPFC